MNMPNLFEKTKVTRSAWAALAASLVLGVSTVPASAMKSEPGLPVKKIRSASEIDSWQAVDQRRVLVSLSASRKYLLTLNRQCPRLDSARSVGVSSSNNTIYAGFDYITADGQRCSIKSISKLSGAEAKRLTKS